MPALRSTSKTLTLRGWASHKPSESEEISDSGDMDEEDVTGIEDAKDVDRDLLVTFLLLTPKIFFAFPPALAEIKGFRFFELPKRGYDVEFNHQ